MKARAADEAARIMYTHVCATIEDFDTIVETAPMSGA
jgi:hypothetical protein